MMQTEGERLTIDDKRELEKNIKELEREIENLNQMCKASSDWEEKDGIDVQIQSRTKKLRQLRRMRT